MNERERRELELIRPKEEGRSIKWGPYLKERRSQTKIGQTRGELEATDSKRRCFSLEISKDFFFFEFTDKSSAHE